MPLYAKDVAINDRRCKVAALKLQGFSHREVAIRLGMGDDDASTAMVSSDLSAIDKVWKESTLRDFDYDKGRILAELEQLKHELYIEWNKSKRRRVSIREQHGAAVAADVDAILEAAAGLSDAEIASVVDGTPAMCERTVDIEQREGDTRFTKQILEIIDKECELLGLSNPDNSGSTAPPVVCFRIHGPEVENGEATNGRAEAVT